MYINISLVSLKVYVSTVFWIYTGQYFDQSGFTGTVFTHQSMYLAFVTCKIHILKRPDSWENLIDAAHFQYCFIFHEKYLLFSILRGAFSIKSPID